MKPLAYFERRESLTNLHNAGDTRLPHKRAEEGYANYLVSLERGGIEAEMRCAKRRRRIMAGISARLKGIVPLGLLFASLAVLFGADQMREPSGTASRSTDIRIYNSDGTVTVGRTVTNMSRSAFPPEFELHWHQEVAQVLPPTLPDFMPGASWPTNTIINTNDYSGIAVFIFKAMCPKCRATNPRCDSVEFIRGVRDNDAVVSVQKYEFKCGKCANKWRKNNVIR